MVCVLRIVFYSAALKYVIGFIVDVWLYACLFLVVSICFKSNFSFMFAPPPIYRAGGMEGVRAVSDPRDALFHGRW